MVKEEYDDWEKVRFFNPHDAKEMRSWAIYIKNGIAYAESSFPAWSAGERRRVKAVLNACIKTCQNIIDAYDFEDKLDQKNIAQAERRNRSLL